VEQEYLYQRKWEGVAEGFESRALGAVGLGRDLVAASQRGQVPGPQGVKYDQKM